MNKIEESLKRIERLLLVQKDVLNVEEVSALTGLSKSFIHKKTAAGQLPFSKPFGKLIFFEKKALFEFLLNNPVTPQADIEGYSINYVTNNPMKGGSW